MQKKTIFFVVGIICLIIAGWLYYLYQQPRTGVENKAADYSIAANTLYEAFVANEAVANQKYVDKVLKVEGIVQHIDTVNGKNVLLNGGTEQGGVNCSLAETSLIPAVGAGVVIKGRCTGFLMDVSLVDGVLESK
jgi:hypothetical protein